MGDVSLVRQAVIAAVSALDGWTQSKFVPELFGRDVDSVGHHSFAVGAPSTEPKDGVQSLSYPMLAFTTVEVSWAHRLKGDAQSTSYDGALDAEQDLVQAVVGISSEHILVTRMTRTAKLEGWITGVATFNIVHRYALA